VNNPQGQCCVRHRVVRHKLLLPTRRGSSHAGKGQGPRDTRLRHVVSWVPCRMARWRPDARQRLEQSALELFLNQGFEQVTVSEIAARAGLTTRTFFRYFADKREVLFAGEQQIPVLAAHLIATASPELAVMEVVARGLRVMAALFQDRYDDLASRRTIIERDEGLKERELRKLADVSDAIAGGLQRRGVDDTTAALAGDAAVSMMRLSILQWIEADGKDLAVILERNMDALRRLTCPPGPGGGQIG